MKEHQDVVSGQAAKAFGAGGNEIKETKVHEEKQEKILKGGGNEDESKMAEDETLLKQKQEKEELEKALWEECYDAIDFLTENVGKLADMYSFDSGFSTEGQAIRNAWNRAAKLKTLIRSSNLKSAITECVILAERIKTVEKESKEASKLSQEDKNVTRKKEKIFSNISQCKSELETVAKALSTIKEKFPERYSEYKPPAVKSAQPRKKENGNSLTETLLEWIRKIAGWGLSKSDLLKQQELNELLAELDKMKLNFDDPLDIETSEKLEQDKSKDTHLKPVKPTWPKSISNRRRSRYTENSLCRTQKLRQKHRNALHKIQRRNAETEAVKRLRQDTYSLLEEMKNPSENNSMTYISQKWSNYNLGLAKEARQEFVQGSTDYSECIKSCHEDPHESSSLEAASNFRTGTCLLQESLNSKSSPKTGIHATSKIHQKGFLPEVIQKYTRGATIDCLSDQQDSEFQAESHLNLSRAYLESQDYHHGEMHSAIAFNLGRTESIKIESRLATTLALWNRVGIDNAIALERDIPTCTMEQIAPWFKEKIEDERLKHATVIERLDKSSEDMWTNHLQTAKVGEILGSTKNSKQKKCIRNMLVGRALVVKQKQEQEERTRKLIAQEKARLAAEEARSPAQIKIEVRTAKSSQSLPTENLFMRFIIVISQTNPKGKRVRAKVSTGKTSSIKCGVNNSMVWNSETGSVMVDFPGVEIGHILTADESLHPTLNVELCYKNAMQITKVFSKLEMKLSPYLYRRNLLEEHSLKLQSCHKAQNEVEVNITSFISNLSQDDQEEP